MYPQVFLKIKLISIVHVIYHLGRAKTSNFLKEKMHEGGKLGWKKKKVTKDNLQKEMHRNQGAKLAV